MIKTILVDDEPIAVKHLEALLGKYGPQLEIIATAATVPAALDRISALEPELVFLDIELAGHRSFEMLDPAKPRAYEVIFVTAHDQFGIQAVKHGAIDYILKPINKTELIEAIEKAARRIYQKRISQGTPETQKPALSRLALPTMDGLLFVDTDKIVFCESEGRYTRFHMANDERKILVSKNLGEFEATLPSHSFIRIHHHSIVNINYVEKYVKGRGGYVVLKNGKNLAVSSRKKDDFFGRL